MIFEFNSIPWDLTVHAGTNAAADTSSVGIWLRDFHKDGTQLSAISKRKKKNIKEPDL